MMPTFSSLPFRDELIDAWLGLNGKGISGSRYKSRTKTFATACGRIAWIRDEFGEAVAGCAGSNTSTADTTATVEGVWRLLDDVIGPLVVLTKELSSALLGDADDAMSGAATDARQLVREKVRETSIEPIAAYLIDAALSRSATEELLVYRVLPPEVRARALATGLTVGRAALVAAPAGKLSAEAKEQALAVLDAHAERKALPVQKPPLPPDAENTVNRLVADAVSELPQWMRNYRSLGYEDTRRRILEDLRYGRELDVVATLRFYISMRKRDEDNRTRRDEDELGEVVAAEDRDEATDWDRGDGLLAALATELAARRAAAAEVWPFDVMAALLADSDNPAVRAIDSLTRPTAFIRALRAAVRAELETNSTAVPAGSSRNQAVELVHRGFVALLRDVANARKAGGAR